MNQMPIWVLLISLFILLYTTHSVEEEVKITLLNFLGKLSNSNGQIDPNLGWNSSSDPCKDRWIGVHCSENNVTVQKLFLDDLNLSGSFDADLLCNEQSLAASLTVISLQDNKIGGEAQAEIGNCKQLTHLHLSRNQFFGNLPDTFSSLDNLKKLDISENQFSGNLPDLARISGLILFLAQNNQLNGEIPRFDFSNLQNFNVSFNNFSGPIPDGGDRFNESSFMGNPGLCGDPLPKICQLPSQYSTRMLISNHHIVIYSGYMILGLVVVSFVIFKLCKMKKRNAVKPAKVKKVAAVADSQSPVSSNYTSCMSRPDFSSADSGLISSSSLVVLSSPMSIGPKFEDLLRAPAQLLGRGKHSSLYKVVLEHGITLVVKRIKDWDISSNDFKKRMERLDQVKHPNVLSAVAFYCSNQEKLLVYEYRHNGSLFRFLHGNQLGQPFEWASRLNVAARISETLAFMHQELRDDVIAHGNLKSSNIFLNEDMQPCISEYGLISMDIEPSSIVKATEQTDSDTPGAFRVDIYGFGVILLELLTGKLVQSNGVDLTNWVHSIVREEWTVEVFDKFLFSGGVSEERMVSLLQVAIKCVSPYPKERLGINQVAAIINSIKEDDERSAVLDSSKNSF